MKNETLAEARRLYDLGFAIIWLHPKSKRPVESGWTTGPRTKWEVLEKTFRPGMNLGVRLGAPSKIGDYYLAVVDVDVKSKDKRHRDEALKAAYELLPNLAAPVVLSGRGGGSRHIYVLTKEPFKTWNPAASDEMVKVHMPSKKPSKREEAELTATEISNGLRLSRAWEVSLYSDGRQVVLPPSVHPDTGKRYSWHIALGTAADIPLAVFPAAPEQKVQKAGEVARKVQQTEKPFEFKAEPVDLELLPVSDDVREAIISGTGVTDRSGYLLRAATALVSGGLNQNQVLTVLTDPSTFLGQCGYDHAQTRDRARAAYWVWKYTVARVQYERNAENIFRDVPVEDPVILDGEALAAQNEDMKTEVDWRVGLERAPKTFKIKNTLKNAKLIIENTFGADCVRFNEFSMAEEAHVALPWNPSFPRELYDIDVTMFKDWFTKDWGYEPSSDKIESALAVIAFENRYHPVKRWLKALPRWDEKERVDRLLSRYIPCIGDPELRAVVGRRFMVALVKRIFEPGCQSDYLLVLEGLQGINKSTAFRTLVGDAWFSDAMINVENKDAVMVIFSKWLIEFGELSTLDRTTAEHTKAFITRRTDRIRAPFDKKARDYPRQCLFVGSTNKEEYLKDDTGNRRFWPFRVAEAARIERIARDREQLFAEALWLYEAGEITYLKEPELQEKMREQQESKEMHDVLVEQVAGAIEAHEKTAGKCLDGFAIRFLFASSHITGVKPDQYGTARVGAALRKLGFEQRRLQAKGQRERLWFRKDDEEKPYTNGAAHAGQDAHHMETKSGKDQTPELH
jgi:predicted P-loop ATPase